MERQLSHLHEPCEPHELVGDDSISSEDIVHEFKIDAETVEAVKENITSTEIDGVKYADLPLSERRGGLDRLAHASAAAVAAAGELILCDTCVVEECPIKDSLENTVRVGEDTKGRVTQRIAEKPARLRFFAGLAAESQQGNRLQAIKKSQENQHAFASIIANQSNDPRVRDDMIKNIYGRLKKKELQDEFYPFILGAVCETATLEQAEQIAKQASNITIEQSTTDEDVREGTDFFMVVGDASGEEHKARVDAKSSTQFTNITTNPQNRVQRFRDNPYTAIVQRPGYDPVLIVNPEGSNKQNALVQHSNIVKEKPLPSYRLERSNEDAFQKSILSGISKMIALSQNRQHAR